MKGYEEDVYKQIGDAYTGAEVIRPLCFILRHSVYLVYKQCSGDILMEISCFNIRNNINLAVNNKFSNDPI